jgi:predicted PurR-regulated permease PerM
MERPDTLASEKLQRHVRNLVLGLFIMALAVFLDFARDFVLPVVLAFFIALTFRPAIRNLAHRRIPEWLSATAFIGIIVGGTVLLIALLSAPIAAILQDAPNYAQIFSSKLQEWQTSLQAILRWASKIQTVAQPADAVAAQEVVIRDGPPIAYLGQITGYSMSVVATLVLTLVIAAFLMASGDLFYAKLVHVLPTLTDKKTALRIVYDVEREISSYLAIVTAVNAGLGLAVGLTFYVLGMPSPIIWGVMAFAFNYVPYVGSIAGVGLAAFMAIVTFDSLSYAVLLPLSYAFWNGVENQFVTPQVLGRRLQLNSVAILLAVAFWTWIWGIAGTMIAVPTLVAIKIFCDHLESLAAIGEFLSEKYPEDKNTVADTSAAAVGK